ncbi:MAG: hypothetical protein JW940_36330 [Polyangiaceae bacterium]|nr:hypothetical protein [Polyangiaceae bacterium]
MKRKPTTSGLAFAGALLCLTLSGCSEANGDSSQSCARIEGIWDGLEIDPYGDTRGSAKFVVRDDHIDGEISITGGSPERYSLRVSCDETPVPSRLSGTITDSNAPDAVGQSFYGIYELDESTSSGRLSGFKPGTREFPSDFAAGNGQRLFVFGSTEL